MNDARTSTLDFAAFAERALGAPLGAAGVATVQVNIGLRCNLACTHCHVASSPSRREEMTWETMLDVIEAACRLESRTLDITGGAPEMHPRFREFVTRARAQWLNVIVRTNLTILLRPGFFDLPVFFRRNRVHLIASLPCYTEGNVDIQRGAHTFKDSISALRRLNAVGYGLDPELRLDLAYNPTGSALPPQQSVLESTYRTRLKDDHGIAFTRLLALTNVPIGRFRTDLQEKGMAAEYLHRLQTKSNPATVQHLMCRTQLHVAYDGSLSDCDFNHADGIPIEGERPALIKAFDPIAVAKRRIATRAHCFACTAGSGSSCGGALT